MPNHVRREQNDGNGFVGGVRLSWPALMFILTVAALVLTVWDKVEARDTAAIQAMDTRMVVGFEKLDKKLDKVTERFMDHCLDPTAHQRTP